MNLIKKLKQTFCFHHWIPVELVDMNIYNKDNIRYARFHSVCEKCLKIDDVDYIMAMEYQDKWNT